MKKTLYHGSDHIISTPQFHGGKPHNDYGYGFYCTESCEMAKEWAVSERRLCEPLRTGIGRDEDPESES